MQEESQQDNAGVPRSEGSEALELIKKIQQHLVFLEKKIDTLLSQTHSRSSEGKNFSKPFRSFDRPYHRPGHRSDQEGPQKSFERGGHFRKDRGEEERGFDRKKRPFSHDRREGSGQARPFEKRHSGEKKEFDAKRKPFYYGRKSRG